ncbi:MAG: GNAT family N-acetyltransferase [Nitrospirota bacterium]
MGSDESLPDYLDFIIDRSVEDDVIGLITDYCIEQKDTWDVIKLSGIKEDAVCFKFYDFLSNKGYKTYRKLDGICPYIKLPETWKDYLNTLSKKSRFNVRKKKRVLDTHYKNSFSIIDNEDHLEEVMDQLSELHRKRMTMKGIKNSYSSSDTFWKFQKKIAAEFFRKGWLLLGILQISGKLAACQYAFKFWDKVFHYQTGFDPAYEKYSVGLISVGHMIEASINSGCEEYDFLRGEEDYKLHWAKSNKELFSAYISNNNAKGRIFLRQHITLQWIKQKIKTFGKR